MKRARDDSRTNPPGQAGRPRPLLDSEAAPKSVSSLGTAVPVRALHPSGRSSTRLRVSRISARLRPGHGKSSCVAWAGWSILPNGELLPRMGDGIVEAYARLLALKRNLPDGFEVQEKWVTEFHQVLDVLETEGRYALGNFRVPPSEIRPKVTSVRMATRRSPGRVTYSKDSHCERSVLMMKIDAVLTFFEFQSTPDKRHIGFKPPDS